MHVGLDYAGNQPDFIGKCIPSLKRWKGEMDREVTGSHNACVYPSFTQQPLCLVIYLMTCNDPERGTNQYQLLGIPPAPEGPSQPNPHRHHPAWSKLPLPSPVGAWSHSQGHLHPLTPRSGPSRSFPWPHPVPPTSSVRLQP